MKDYFKENAKAMKQAKKSGGIKSKKPNLEYGGIQYNYKDNTGYWVEPKRKIKK